MGLGISGVGGAFAGSESEPTVERVVEFTLTQRPPSFVAKSEESAAEAMRLFPGLSVSHRVGPCIILVDRSVFGGGT